VITAMELYAGCRSKKDLKKVQELLSGINIELVTKAASEKAFELMKKFRSSHGVEINDMLIAAAAMTLEVKLISKNQKHYTFLPGLDLLKYPVSEV
jgi:predicted nucleic acid-binding protein